MTTGAGKQRRAVHVLLDYENFMDYSTFLAKSRLNLVFLS
jgi:hypothetical protein